jgi:hypothetical protein
MIRRRYKSWWCLEWWCGGGHCKAWSWLLHTHNKRPVQTCSSDSIWIGMLESDCISVLFLFCSVTFLLTNSNVFSENGGQVHSNSKNKRERVEGGARPNSSCWVPSWPRDTCLHGGLRSRSHVRRCGHGCVVRNGDTCVWCER